MRILNRIAGRPLEAFATRRTLDGKNPGGWFPEQKIGVEDALRAYTIGGAYAMFADANRGTLEPGKRVDMDSLTCKVDGGNHQ